MSKHPLTGVTLVVLAALAMLAFAANSVLARLALTHTSIDAASFTSIRLVAGALMLLVLVQWPAGPKAVAPREPWYRQGSWAGALALFVYAAGFSFAYLSLDTGTGALLLFGAVQLTMLGAALWSGERLQPKQWLGLLLALAGLVLLLLPGATQPQLLSALLMLSAGVAWGCYSLWGRGSQRPLLLTAGNFWRTIPLALLLSVWHAEAMRLPVAGVLYAALSGALASAVGYAIWYRVLPALRAFVAATLQLSVPVLAAFAGILLLGEAMTPRLLAAGGLTLGGILLVIWQRHTT